jgi:sec-independent protein translocase protein TatC
VAAALAHAYLPPDDDPNPRAGGMSILEHLEELRKRILRACIAIAGGVIVSFFFIDRIVAFVFAPMRRALPPGTAMIYTAPGEAFGLWIDIALISGTVIASPFIMFQVWRFIAPALYTNEKKLAIPFVLLASAGVAGGWMFSHYVVFPSTIRFFGLFSSPDLRFLPRIEDAFGLYVRMLMGMVLVFQLPTVVFFLARMRMVTARFLAVNIKYAILIIFIVAAVLTPDGSPWNQTLFALPMIGLYLLSIAIAWAVRPAAAGLEPD